MNVLDIVKAKLTEPVEDILLLAYIAEVGQALKNYMNRSDIPNELMFVHANIVLDLITNENRKADPDSQQSVTSVKEGDVTVQFGAAKVESRERVMERLLFDYTSQLNRFRKLRW